MPDLGLPAHVEKCRQVAANGYEGFKLKRAWTRRGATGSARTPVDSASAVGRRYAASP